MESVMRVTDPGLRDQCARLFGVCVAERWPVRGNPEEGYQWVCEEVADPQTILVGIVDSEGFLVACMAASPLQLLWGQLQDEERWLLMTLVGLEGTEGIEIPTSLAHVGSIAVLPTFRHRQLPEQMFQELLPLIRGEMGATHLVAQTARPNRKHQIKGLAMCERLGFRQIVAPQYTLRRTVGGVLEKVWLWRRT
ncbi:MAG: hypothetical protein KIH62_005155 [Candidatus Kerfeldbacteria bacterium]|nr:hypothetical protein [Candidatus Kerfeldbacteria bacterium]